MSVDLNNGNSIQISTKDLMGPGKAQSTQTAGTGEKFAAAMQGQGDAPGIMGPGLSSAAMVVNSAVGQRASGQNVAFGAGASALPGGDMSGGSGMGIGGASAGGGATGAGSSSAIGSAAGGGGQDQLLNATKQMQETQMSFNLQYLQLQSQMQSENRSYTAVSNIMKTKHDTVKNSISNIR